MSAFRLNKVALGVMVLGLCNCTDARLFNKEGAAGEADRAALAGRVCADDPVAAALPLRVVLVADRSQALATYDPSGERVRVLSLFMESALDSPHTELAVVGYAGRSEQLAPVEGNFTRNPGELLNAINQLAVVQPCIGEDQCRDYLAGLRTARSIIEGDLAETSAGPKVVTQYVVIFMVAGPHEPLAENIDCCAPDDAACLGATPSPSPPCQSQLELQELAAAHDAVAREGGLGLKMHVLHLGASDAATNDQMQDKLTNLAFQAGGSYQRFDSPTAISPASLNLLGSRTSLRIKALIAANINAKPGPNGPVPDSDADGLPDREEAVYNTSPTDPDTDQDRIGDFVEILIDFDPTVPDEPLACADLTAADRDLDGLTDCEEALLGTDPTLVDSDGDAMPDFLEVVSLTDYLHPDVDQDTDGDGASNGDEILQHTDPRSTDADSHLTSGYRYELLDEGTVTEIHPVSPVDITGVRIVDASDGTTAGVGLLSYDAANQTLQWQDIADAQLGPAVSVQTGGSFQIPSSSWAPAQQDDGRFVVVEVQPQDLPLSDVSEQIRVVFRTRHCVSYTVRNIRMMDTAASSATGQAGLNRIVLFASESAGGHRDRPGPFRLAEIPIVFRPPDFRSPQAAVIEVGDAEFIRPL